MSRDSLPVRLCSFRWVQQRPFKIVSLIWPGLWWYIGCKQLWLVGLPPDTQRRPAKGRVGEVMQLAGTIVPSPPYVPILLLSLCSWTHGTTVWSKEGQHQFKGKLHSDPSLSIRFYDIKTFFKMIGYMGPFTKEASKDTPTHFPQAATLHYLLWY